MATSGSAERPDQAQSPDLDPVIARLAQRIGGMGTHRRLWLDDRIAPLTQRVADVLHQAADVDKAVYAAIAKVPTPALDVAMRRLSNSANRSVIWLGVAAGL